MEPITGTAAGVPFTALPPGSDHGSAPMIVTWHMLDAPRSDAAFAAALPMTEVPAWRVHLGMPLCGARMVDGKLDAHVERAQQDPLLAYFEPVVRQAVDEFPAALAALREQLPVDDGPIALVGGSLGGTVALQVLTTDVPVVAAALVNPAVRVRTAVGLVEAMLGQPYEWTPEAIAVAHGLDFVARAGDLRDVPLLFVSGEEDHPVSRGDATELLAALPAIELVEIPGLAHAVAEEPGLEPASQTLGAVAVDEALTRFFRRMID